MTKDIFDIIREKHDLKKYCEDCGIDLISIGKSDRANSPFTGASNAFNIDKNNPNYWYDHSLKKSGDVIEFSALFNHKGDTHAALLELAPKGYSAEIDKYARDKQSVLDYIMGAHNNIPEYIIKYFESRGVNLEQINRLKLGCRGEPVNKNWLVIPRVDFNGDFRYYRLRRAPDENGKENEYLQPERYKAAYIGDNSFLKNIPLGLQTLSRDSKYLVPCEGDFDYLNFEREGFAVIATGGGGINKEILKIICDNAENRIVVLAFDNDEAGKKYTTDGANLLFKRKITFHVAILPENCKDINDYYRSGGDLQKLCDDSMPGLEYLALNLIPDEDFNTLSRGKQQTLKKNIKKFFIECRRSGLDNADIQTLCECLIKRGLSEKWLAEIKQKSEAGDSEYEISQHLQEQHNLLFNEKTGFFEYDTDTGEWRQASDTKIGSYVLDYLGHEAKSRKINSTVDLMKKAVNSDIPIETFNQLPLIPLKNGTIHLNLERLSETHLLSIAPTDYVTSRLEYDYNREATCEEWIKTLQEIFAGDERRIKCLQEFCGYMWLPDCRFQKALYLRGDGSNGKSLILNVLAKLHGDKNVSAVKIADLLNDFKKINLLYSRVNICTEEKTKILGAEADFKEVVAGELTTACYKMKDIITFKPHAKWIFAVNGALETSCKDFAMMRRILLIDCPVRFVDDEPEGNNPLRRRKDYKLEARLMTPESLSGIFNWTVGGLIRLLKQEKFTETAEQTELPNAFTSKSDSIDNFVAECGSEWADNDFTQSEIYVAYSEFCLDTNIYNTVSRECNFFSAFERALAKYRIPVKKGQKHDGTRYYKFYTIQENQ